MRGKVCFLAGGTGGLGLSIARAFADRGAVVIVGSRSPERHADAAQALGTERFLPIDVTDERSVRMAFERTVERHGRLDVMVNAAGIIARVPTLDMKLDAWERVLRVNVTGTFLTSRAAAGIMRDQDPRPNGERGCILHFASISAFSGFADVAAYGASKAAVVNLTYSFANDWAKYGIRVNALAPGVLPTDLNRGLVEGTPRGENLLAHTPAGRFGVPDEIVGAAAYLCGDSATFTTGVVLPVDGGFLARGVWA
jgi:NAD(P)-dependent dehydrogenase (short-subunit alcohol dehydrogenase family)